MNPPDQAAKLPTWLFLLADFTLIGLAALIAFSASGRPSTGQMVVIVACVGLGAGIALVPLIARYERQKNEALDERQRALEALAATVAASADQLSIAAGSLHEIAELAQKNLRQAEQLPHRLQEKIAEFQAQLAQAGDTEKEELERELLALRTSESERLESVSQRIAKSSAEWAKLEAATQQHLAAATDALAKLQLGAANAIGKAQAAAEQALAQARIEAARHLGETSGHATQAIEAAKSAALAEIEAALLATARKAAASLAQDLPVAPTPATTSPAVAESSATPAPTDDPVPALASAPKRPRKTRRDHAPAETPMASAAADSADFTNPSPAATEPPTPSSSTGSFEEPTPIQPERFSEITPVAPHTAPPFAFTPSPPAAANGEQPDAPATTPSEPAKPARKRAPKKSESDTDAEPDLGLDLDDPATRAATAGILDRVLSSDGVTRLIVTAYIGIGNRLFIRGEGPGLSWEKGVPLQFVSIGKWRWETSDASGPVQFKLYKNDDVECAALGTQTLDPGHQQEVTAAF